jgi:hypothetical protein
MRSRQRANLHHLLKPRPGPSLLRILKPQLTRSRRHRQHILKPQPGPSLLRILKPQLVFSLRRIRRRKSPKLKNILVSSNVTASR